MKRWIFTVGMLLLASVAFAAHGGRHGKDPEIFPGGSDKAATFSGQATVVDATVLGVRTVIVDTGPLPASGGAEEASLLNVNVPGLLSAEVLHATTVGQGDRVRSEASVANVALTVAGNTVTADVLSARAEADCSPSGGATVSGSSEILGLVVNG